MPKNPFSFDACSFFLLGLWDRSASSRDVEIFIGCIYNVVSLMQKLVRYKGVRLRDNIGQVNLYTFLLIAFVLYGLLTIWFSHLLSLKEALWVVFHINYCLFIKLCFSYSSPILKIKNWVKKEELPIHSL